MVGIARGEEWEGEWERDGRHFIMGLYFIL